MAGFADAGEVTGMLPPPPFAFAPPAFIAAPADERVAAPARRAITGLRPSEGAPSGAAGQYTIQVAALKTRDHAEGVVAELVAAGYRARQIEMDGRASGDRLVHVVVDGYSSAIEVERDLRRIRELPGYAGARIVER